MQSIWRKPRRAAWVCLALILATARPVFAADVGPFLVAADQADADTEPGAQPEPPEPYEIGSDKVFKDTWADGFQAEAAHKDFRVKIGGRTQVDAVAFTKGQQLDQPRNQGGLDPELSDTVAFRRARLRIEGRMYEFYDWACEYDFVNQINVNNEVYPTERDSGPLTAVTDLWLQIRELPILGIVRIGNQKDPYGYEHLTSSRWLNFMERSFAQDAFEGPASRSSTRPRTARSAGRSASSKTRATRSASATPAAAA
jgi:phosphate-selective porin